jgi:transcriptional regulator with XRE-family HTH domain
MTPDRNVSKLLTDWRAQARLSQSQAAEVLGVSVRSLQGWEAGLSMPYPRLLEMATKPDVELIRWALDFAYNAETGREWTDEELATAAAYMRRGEDPWEAAAAICEGFEL